MNALNNRLQRFDRRQHGLTMIELLIGMVLGIATTVVIAQALLASESQRRGTTAGSDAQVNGAVALYSLQREVMTAGYGMSDRRDGFGCTLRARHNGTDFNWRFEPMVITDGGPNGESDTFTIVASDKAGFSAPLRVTVPYDGTNNQFEVNTTVGVVVGDIMIAVPRPLAAADICGMFNVTSIPPGAVRHDADATTGPWNQAVGSSIFPPPAAKVNSGSAVLVYEAATTIVNMGRASMRTFAVNANDALTESAFDTAVGMQRPATELYSNVVNVQAYYGKDTNGDETVDTYNTVQPTDGNQWRQVRTVRLVVVTRSGQWEKDEVTSVQPVLNLGAAPTVAGAAACGSDQCITLRVNRNADWRHYRYKVYDTVVPLRNLLWNSAP